MKKIVILLAFLPGFLQAQVIVKKPVTILTIGKLAWSTFLQRQINTSDTSYYLSFRNTAYHELVDMETAELSKSQLRELGKSFKMVLTLNISEEIWSNHIQLSKQKVGFGSIGYQLYYDNGFCRLNEKEINKIIETIDRE